MNLYTSNFSSIKTIKRTFNDSDIHFYSIAGYPPKWYDSAIDNRYSTLRGLAPKKYWWTEWHEKFKSDLESKESIDFYTKKYYDTILCNINIHAYINMIKNCTSAQNVFLLCYENKNSFCHRHILRKFINDNGIKCQEFQADEEDVKL